MCLSARHDTTTKDVIAMQETNTFSREDRMLFAIESLLIRYKRSGECLPLLPRLAIASTKEWCLPSEDRQDFCKSILDHVRAEVTRE
jgi:hypothetical protein